MMQASTWASVDVQGQSCMLLAAVRRQFHVGGKLDAFNTFLEKTGSPTCWLGTFAYVPAMIVDQFLNDLPGNRTTPLQRRNRDALSM